MISSKISVFSNLKLAYGKVLAAFKKNPGIYVPFLVFALLETLSLIFLYLSPREPLRIVMGPIIKTLWGEQFLHYPNNFVLLPKMASLARIVISIFFGSLLTGMAVCLLYKKSISNALNKYANLFMVVFILSIIFYFTNKAMYVFLLKYFNSGHEKLLFIGPKFWLGPFNILVSQLLVLLMQSIFAYTIPSIILFNKKFFIAILDSCLFFIKNMGVTLLLVGLPLLIAIPVILLNYNSGFLVMTFFPEIILVLGLLGIVVNSLVLDPLITLGTAAYYAEKKGEK